MTTTSTHAPASDAPAHAGRWAGAIAAAVALQPLLIAVNALFHPDVEMSAESLLAGAAEGPGRWYAVHLVAALGAALGAPAAVGLRHLLRGGGRTLADVALAAALLASVVLATTFVAEASLLRLAVTADVERAAALELVDAYTSTPEFFAVGAGVLASSVAGILFAVALLRQRVVGRWIPWAMLAGNVLGFAAAPGTPVGPVAFGLLAAAGFGLAPSIRRAFATGATGTGA